MWKMPFRFSKLQVNAGFTADCTKKVQEKIVLPQLHAKFIRIGFMRDAGRRRKEELRRTLSTNGAAGRA
jgi:hypothetical protein